MCVRVLRSVHLSVSSTINQQWKKGRHEARRKRRGGTSAEAMGHRGKSFPTVREGRVRRKSFLLLLKIKSLDFMCETKGREDFA